MSPRPLSTPHPGPVLRTSRRAAIAAAVAAPVALSGCDLSDAEQPGASSSSPSASDPDESLLDEVLAALGAITAYVEGARRRQRRLQPHAEVLLAMHAAHRGALGDVTDVAPEKPDTTTPLDEQWSVVVAREKALQARLAGWAVDAQSGTLARLLASMSAGIAAHLAAAPSASTVLAEAAPR